MDERKGRNIVKNVYGLNVIGTSGILLKAKESGIVNEISPIFQELKKINYFIADVVYDDLLHTSCKTPGFVVLIGQYQFLDRPFHQFFLCLLVPARL